MMPRKMEREMTKETIEINLERFIDFDSLEENVIRKLADICASKLTGGHTDSFHKMCVTAIEKAVSDRVEQRITELLSKPIVPRDRFGEAAPDAEAKTLGDMLAEAVDHACTETVGRDGKPKKNTPYDNAIPRIQWHLSRVMSREIDQEAAKAIKQLNEEAKKKVRQQIATAIAAQLAK